MYICTHVHAPNPPYVYMYIRMYGNTHTTISKNTSHKIEQNSSCILFFKLGAYQQQASARMVS